jgi:two-component system, cell cycle sensor histidine kinase and response regulator CckA
MINAGDSKNGCVLVVDDEPGIRALLKLHLEKSGISAIDASSAEEALAVFARERSRIRLLITDIVMPRMSGRDLALSLRQVYPGLPILYISGFTDQVPEESQGIPCIQKPLDFRRLVEQVKVMVGSTPRRAAPG